MNRISILFWLKQGKYISCRLTIDGKRAKELSTGVILSKKDLWDSDRQIVRGQSEEAVSANNELLKIRIALKEIISEMQKKSKLINPDKVISTFKGEGVSRKTLLKCYEEMILRMQQLEKEGEYRKTTVRRNESLKRMMGLYIKDFHKTDDVFLEEVDEKFIKDLEHWGKTKVIDGIEDGKKVKLKKIWNHNTATKHLQKLSEIITTAFEDGIISRNPFAKIDLKFSKPKHKFLYQAEVKLIEDFVFSSEPLNLVRDIFLFQCYSGLAYSDVFSLNSDDLIRNVSGQLCISKDRYKTGEAIYIPLTSKELEIIEKYKNHHMCKLSGNLLPVYTNQKYNTYLHQIADIIGLKRDLTTHVARHTAATYLLNKGVPKMVICRRLGMSQQVLDRIYGAVLPETVEAEMMALDQRETKTSELELTQEIRILQEKLNRIKQIQMESSLNRMSS